MSVSTKCWMNGMLLGRCCLVNGSLYVRFVYGLFLSLSITLCVCVIWISIPFTDVLFFAVFLNCNVQCAFLAAASIYLMWSGQCVHSSKSENYTHSHWMKWNDEKLEGDQCKYHHATMRFSAQKQYATKRKSSTVTSTAKCDKEC